MLAALVLQVATVGGDLAAVAPYVALAVPLAAVSAFAYLLLARWARRVANRRRTRAALAKLSAAMEAEIHAAMANVSAQLAAMPLERWAALGLADPDDTHRYPAGRPMTEEK